MSLASLPLGFTRTIVDGMLTKIGLGGNSVMSKLLGKDVVVVSRNETLAAT